MTRPIARARERIVWSRAYQRPAGVLAGPHASRYLVTVGHDPAFVWFQVPKAASRTILSHLVTHAEISLRRGIRLVPPWVFRGRYAFAFVRDPWDRLVSTWSDKAVHLDHYGLPGDVRGSFPSFVHWVAERVDLPDADRHLRPQHRLVDLDRADFVGRFETFSRDFEQVCRTLGLPPCDQHRNASRHDAYTAYYDRDLAALVGRLYAEDVEAFGYRPPEV